MYSGTRVQVYHYAAARILNNFQFLKRSAYHTCTLYLHYYVINEKNFFLYT